MTTKGTIEHQRKNKGKPKGTKKKTKGNANEDQNAYGNRRKAKESERKTKGKPRKNMENEKKTQGEPKETQMKIKKTLKPQRETKKEEITENRENTWTEETQRKSTKNIRVNTGNQGPHTPAWKKDGISTYALRHHGFKPVRLFRHAWM